MVHTKNPQRKQSARLPVARFPTIATGRAERDKHYMMKLQLLPQAEELDWTALTPSLSGAASPELERVVERINEEHANLPLQNMKEVFELVQDLCANPPTSPAMETVTGEDNEPSTSNVEADKEVSTTTPSPPTLTVETVVEAIRLPLLLAKRALATLAPQKGRPNPPPNCSCQVPLERVPATQLGGDKEEDQEA